MASIGPVASSDLDTKDLMPSLRNLEICANGSTLQGERTSEKDAESCFSPARITTGTCATGRSTSSSHPNVDSLSRYRDPVEPRSWVSDAPPRGFYGKVKGRRRLRGRKAPVGDMLSTSLRPSSRTKRRRKRNKEKKQLKEIISKFSKLDTKEDAVARRDRELEKLLMEEMESELIFMLSKGCVVTDQPAKFMPYIC
eukprot:CAMPEP_0170175806 /NCGR_PEP_ID=MMETSP0040_2-20121228/8815_1 /TAXON_ID=641309 /ORGANISM="Lotharella oceanica, Strain CCMP622" /LENGTH=196 /DNA_ID=CAMNT_0010417919 /DNA_START=28 /DNA_END=618 /DNA_ORIENTATION=+